MEQPQEAVHTEPKPAAPIMDVTPPPKPDPAVSDQSPNTQPNAAEPPRQAEKEAPKQQAAVKQAKGSSNATAAVFVAIICFVVLSMLAYYAYKKAN